MHEITYNTLSRLYLPEVFHKHIVDTLRGESETKGSIKAEIEDRILDYMKPLRARLPEEYIGDIIPYSFEKLLMEHIVDPISDIVYDAVYIAS